MKKMKARLLGILMTAVLLVTSVMPVMAADGHTHNGGTPIEDESGSYTITLTQPEGVTIEEGACYGAYQIFSGTVPEITTGEGSKDNPYENPGNDFKGMPITDIKWGNAFGVIREGANEVSDTTAKRDKIVRFVYALATASDPGKNPNYAYAFRGFTQFSDFAGTTDNTLADRFYYDTDKNGSIDTGERTNENVNYDKLAVAVAQELAKHEDSKWLQQFTDILGGYANGSTGYENQGYVDRFYESEKKTDGDTVTYEIKVPAGYYMIRDLSTVEEGETDSAYSARLLFVASNVKQELKSSVPKLEKHVMRTVSDTAGKTEEKEFKTEAAGVGDVVKFRLTGTLPSNYENFLGGYKYIFTDTLDDGLTLNEIKETTGASSDPKKYVTVTAKGWWKKDASGTETWVDDEKTIDFKSFVTEGTGESHHHFDSDDDNTYSEKVDGQILTVDFPCLKEIRVKEGDVTYRLGYNTTGTGLESSQISITYTATVNYLAIVDPAVLAPSGTVTDPKGNANSATLTYSDNPQAYEDTDNTTAEVATVYTYGLELTKVDSAEFIKANGDPDGKGVALKGAEFVIVRPDPTDDTKYQIAKFTGIAGKTGGPFEGSAYRSILEWEELSIAADSNLTETVTKFLNYDATTGKIGAGKEAYIVTSDENGKIYVSGLDDGITYTMIETKTPAPSADYAKIDPFTLTIAPEMSADEYTGEIDSVTVTKGITDDTPVDSKHYVKSINKNATAKEDTEKETVTYTFTEDDDTYAKLLAANFKYESLPSTGGRGTTLYVIFGGGIIMTAILLFMFSRKKKED